MNAFKRIIPLFSYLFHPLFIPVLGTLYFFLLSEPYKSYTSFQVYLVLFQVSIITVCIPIAFFYLLRSLGKIDTIMVSELTQRKLPLLMQLILLSVLIQKGTSQDRIPELYFYFLGGIISAFLALLFLFLKIKASLHLLGMGSLLFFVIGLSIHNQINALNSIAAITCITGLVATSRLEMKAHNNKELTIGLLIGFLPQLLLWRLWL